jgi:hypothetical protein
VWRWWAKGRGPSFPPPPRSRRRCPQPPPTSLAPAPAQTRWRPMRELLLRDDYNRLSLVSHHSLGLQVVDIHWIVPTTHSDWAVHRVDESSDGGLTEDILRRLLEGGFAEYELPSGHNPSGRQDIMISTPREG